MVNEIQYGNTAKNSLLVGINKVAETVKPTLGPKARTVVLEQEHAFPMILNDGVKIAAAIHDEDPFVNMGIKLIQQVAIEAQGGAGDGTTTAITIAESLANAGMKLVNEGEDPVLLKAEIEEATEKVIDYLKDIAIEVTDEQLVNVASIAANNDRELGELIAQIYTEVGPQGVVTMERGHTTKTEYHITEGVEVERGYLSPVMVNNHETGTFQSESPLILITDRVIDNFHDLVPALEVSIESGRPLVIFGQNLAGNALPQLLVNIAQGQLRACFVKVPGWNDELTNTLKDLAQLTGATMIDSNMGMKLNEVTKEDLGSCLRISANHRRTTIVQNMEPAQREVFDTYLSNLKSQADECEHDWDAEKILTRLAKLSGGVAVIRVGAVTEVELAETTERIDDALNATKAAMEQGIIPGGGAALVHAVELGDTAGKFYVSGEMTLGDELVGNAIIQPALTIAKNAGYDLDFGELCDESSGMNANTGKYEDMIAAGIVDPLKVTCSALRAASSITGLILTTEAAVPLRKKEVVSES